MSTEQSLSNDQMFEIFQQHRAWLVNAWEWNIIAEICVNWFSGSDSQMRLERHLSIVYSKMVEKTRDELSKIDPGTFVNIHGQMFHGLTNLFHRRNWEVLRTQIMPGNLSGQGLWTEFVEQRLLTYQKKVQHELNRLYDEWSSAETNAAVLPIIWRGPKQDLAYLLYTLAERGWIFYKDQGKVSQRGLARHVAPHFRYHNEEHKPIAPSNIQKNMSRRDLTTQNWNIPQCPGGEQLDMSET